MQLRYASLQITKLVINMSGNNVESSIELRIFIDSIPQIDTILATIVGQYITLNIQ